MTDGTVDYLSPEEFEQAINNYIDWATEWDGALPADVFFGVWADFEREKKPLELKARLVEGELELVSPSTSSVTTVGYHVYFEDGRELVIKLQA